jgi:hypothetical protein
LKGAQKTLKKEQRQALFCVKRAIFCQKDLIFNQKNCKILSFLIFSSHFGSFAFGRVTITLYLFHFLLRVVGLGGAG